MRGLRAVAAGTFAGAILIAGCGSGSTTASSPPVTLASGCSTGSGVTASATTKSYAVRLDVGPLETMYTPAEAAAQHPTDGEVMISGTMSSVGGMSGMAGMGGSSTTVTTSGSSSMGGMGGPDSSTSTTDSMAGMPGMSGSATTATGHHLEAHICSRATGQPVQGAHPTINVASVSAPNVSQSVPIAVMQGVTEGVADYHYGNNVDLEPGDYTVTVSLNGQTATLHVTLPVTSSSTSTTESGMSGMSGMGGTTSTT